MTKNNTHSSLRISILSLPRRLPTKTMRKLWNNNRNHIILGAVISIFFVVSYSLIVTHKYLQFEYFFVDNVYFHSALWKISRFEEPIVLHQHLGELNIFGDHFHPVILILGLLLMVIPSNLTILLSMPVLYGMGGFVGHLIALKLGISKLLSYCLLTAYFLFLPAQYSFLFGFHEIHFAPLFFLSSMWSIIHKRMLLYWTSIALLLLTKESMSVVVLATGIFIWFLNPNRKVKLTAIATVLLAISYYFLATKVIIPHYSGGFHLYTSLQLPTSAEALYSALTKPSEKIETFVISLAGYGFLPLLNISTLALVLQDFFVRYVIAIPGSLQYLLTYHYGVALSPILFFSSIWISHTLKLTRFAQVKTVIAIISVLCGIWYTNLVHESRSPIFLTFNSGLYQNTGQNRFLWSLIHNTPKSGTVMAQNHLGTALSDRSQIYPLGRNATEVLEIQPDYIVYDTRSGQNANNFFPTDSDSWKKSVTHLLNAREYSTYYEEGSLTILERKRNN